MLVEGRILAGISSILQKITVVNISGESGTGKTSFALYLVSQLLQNEEYCIWIQASESFPKKRLETMYGKNRKRLDTILNQVFIAPDRCFATYDAQSEFMVKINHENYLFPPNLQFIVIDNISHHLRFKLSQVSEISEKVLLLDKFYSSELLPLILYCSREKIILILIHEVSFNVKLQKTQPFFYKLYGRIEGANIVLTQSLYTKKRVMDLAIKDQSYSFQFEIKNNGFNFSNLFL